MTFNILNFVPINYLLGICFNLSYENAHNIKKLKHLLKDVKKNLHIYATCCAWISIWYIYIYICKVSWSKDMQIFFLPKYIQRSSTHASIWLKKTSILSMFINCWQPQHFAIVDTTRKLTNKLTNSTNDVTIWTGIGEIIISSCCVSYYHWNRFWLVRIYLNNLMKLCLLWSLFRYE